MPERREAFSDHPHIHVTAKATITRKKATQ